ncbi:Nucleoside-triphosphatase THEP1 [Gossypium australe]|uniref:Nucleoside-triphosphatase THEP1 n=1 Tax=Gossypium australe TaxID=47621 RepID=A0A5B6UX68_9ROSI|nr:Nucleoside-triphosphatase THEP1 [Gossypium australe]
MGNGFLDKVEDNVAVRIWSEKRQQEKSDSLSEGYMSELWDFTSISVTQNNLQELKEIRDQWNDEIKQLFYREYGYLPYLLDVRMDKYLFRALAQYWNPAYSCITFEKVDLVPTVKKYTTLFRYPKVQVDKAYSKATNVPTFLKWLMNITGMSEQWVATRIKQKEDNARKKVDIFGLSIYGLVIFPKILGHVDDVVSNLFDPLDKRVTPVPAILAKTFKSLSACRRAGRKSLLSSVLLGLFSVERIPGYPKTMQHF